MDVNQFYSEAYNYVCERKQPFNFFHKYWVITTGRKQLFDKCELPWVDYLLDKYVQYNSAGFSRDESEINALMDGLESLVNGDRNNYLYVDESGGF
jgi:hypothetical protein